jgi:hypothetical protein
MTAIIDKGLFGGARRNRTDDLFNAIEALSQLSYGPTLCDRKMAPVETLSRSLWGGTGLHPGVSPECAAV